MIIHSKSGTSKVVLGSLCFILATVVALQLGKGKMGSNLPNSIQDKAVVSKRTKTSSDEQRASSMRRRIEQNSNSDSLLEIVLATPENSTLEARLIVELAHWAEEDIHAVLRWIKANDGRLPGSRRWLGEVLVELATKQPRKALEFGLSINETSEKYYEVIPRDLLIIAVRNLSAEDAIRVMESPTREISPSFENPGYFIGAPYLDGFDFKALGKYIVGKTEKQTWKNYWNPVDFPSDYLKEWTKIDYDSSYAHAVAMNPYAPGAILGMEIIDVLSAYAETAIKTDLVERTRDILTDPDLNVSANYLAYLWIGKSEEMRNIILKVADSLPGEVRDAMGRDALIMYSTDNSSDGDAFRASALEIFGSQEARMKAAMLVMRNLERSEKVHPDALEKFRIQLAEYQWNQ